MKHLFLIHSHTVFLTAMGVIEKLKLSNENIIFVTLRNYNPPTIGIKYKCYDLSEIFEEGYHIFFSYSRKHFLYNKKNRDDVVNKLDSFVDKYVGNDYYLYIPHMQAPVFQILATNKKCIECFFLQEGARVMYDLITNKNKWYFSLYNKFVLRNETRMWKAYAFFPCKDAKYKKTIKVFAFDKHYFGNLPKETILVSWPKLETGIRLDSSFPIFVLEGAVELGQVEKNVYMHAVEKLIMEYGKANNYIKFHPQQSNSTRNMILDMFKNNGKNVEPLPMDVPLELILSSHENLTICGFGSSLLFYAKSFGHIVVSNEKDLMVSPRYRMYCKNIQRL